MIKKKQESREIVLDLTGPDGNAYALLAHAANFAKQLDYSSDEIKALEDDMKSSDYDHLVKTFDDEFGHFVTLLVHDDEEEE